MAYTYDANLEFLNEYNDEQLKVRSKMKEIEILKQQEEKFLKELLEKSYEENFFKKLLKKSTTEIPESNYKYNPDADTLFYDFMEEESKIILTKERYKISDLKNNIKNNNLGFHKIIENDMSILLKDNKEYTGSYEEISRSKYPNMAFDDINGIDTLLWLPYFDKIYNKYYIEKGTYIDGKKDGEFHIKILGTKLVFKINYKSNLQHGNYIIYCFNEITNMIEKIYEEGIFENNKKILEKRYFDFYKTKLKILESDGIKMEKRLIFEDGIEVLKVHDKNIEEKDFYDCGDYGILKVYKYDKNKKLILENFYEKDNLIKSIEFKKNGNISYINYYNIYLDPKSTSIFDIKKDYSLYLHGQKKFFKNISIEKENIKIFDDKNNKILGKYSSHFIEKLDEENLLLQVLKDNKASFAPKIIYTKKGKLESCPTIKEYFDESNKIYKKDFFEVGKIMTIFFYDSRFHHILELQPILKKTEYLDAEGKTVKTKKINKAAFIYKDEYQTETTVLGNEKF